MTEEIDDTAIPIMDIIKNNIISDIMLTRTLMLFFIAIVSFVQLNFGISRLKNVPTKAENTVAMAGRTKTKTVVSILDFNDKDKNRDESNVHGSAMTICANVFAIKGAD